MQQSNRWLGLAVAALLVPAGGRLAALGPGGTEPQPPPRFADRAALTVGNVEVTVLDGDGQPVAGLRRDDFALWVDGVERPIEYFAASCQAGAPVAEPTVPDVDAATAAPAVDSAPPPPERPRVLVILIDNANTSVFNRNHVLTRLAEHVQANLRPPDTAVVAVYDTYMRFACNPTSDPEAIVAALEELGERSGNVGANQAFRRMAERQIRDYAERSDPRTGGATLDQALVAARVNAQHMRDTTEQTVDAFKTLLRILSGVPGRKSVLYVSDGLPRSPGIETFQLLLELFPSARMSMTEFQTYETTPLWQELGRWAAAADVTFYTLDARGLQAGAEKAAEFGRTMPGARGADQRRSTDIEVLHLQNYQDPLIAIANLTGGVAIVNTNKFEEGLERITEITETTYSLGFALEPAEANAVHSAHVELREHTGLSLRYRNTLVQRTTEARMADRTYAGLGFGVLENPLAIRILLGEPSPAGRKTYSLPVTVLVPLDKLTLLPQNGDMAGTLAVWTVASGDEGSVSPLDRQQHAVTVPADKLDRVGVIAVQGAVEVRAGRCRVSVGVLDGTSGEAGFAAAEKQVGKS